MGHHTCLACDMTIETSSYKHRDPLGTVPTCSQPTLNCSAVNRPFGLTEKHPSGSSSVSVVQKDHSRPPKPERPQPAAGSSDATQPANTAEGVEAEVETSDARSTPASSEAVAGTEPVLAGEQPTATAESVADVPASQEPIAPAAVEAPPRPAAQPSPEI